MKSRRLLPLVAALSLAAVLGGCSSTGSGVVASGNGGPHAGREWETGLGALTDVLRPYSKVKDPVEFEKRGQALKSYGTLMDLVGN